MWISASETVFILYPNIFWLYYLFLIQIYGCMNSNDRRHNALEYGKNKTKQKLSSEIKWMYGHNSSV